MLQSINDLMGYRIAASDGEIGTVADVLFDDSTSALRYVVVDTGTWLSGRQVLLAPAAFGAPNPTDRTLPTALTRHQVESSPDLSSDMPVSRQLEESVHSHYGWAPYWQGQPGLIGIPWGVPPLAADVDPDPHRLPEGDLDRSLEGELRAREMEGQDPHLRAASEVIGYYVKARDGDIGHVEDLLFDPEERVIRYVVVDTANWLPGRKVLVATHWFHDVDWFENTITADLTRREIEASPEYDPSRAFGREEEGRLYGHYGRTGYWI
ncbi:MAG TPA: PRC-barrel domain-containing protein [Geminicoccaceae bacterium]|nr:PRC-barrel domain-containing protein [Geminicoccaceae bacterium]